jgi:hypothetical protein
MVDALNCARQGGRNAEPVIQKNRVTRAGNFPSETSLEDLSSFWGARIRASEPPAPEDLLSSMRERRNSTSTK